MKQGKQSYESWDGLKHRWLLEVSLLNDRDYLLHDLHNHPSKYNKSESNFIKNLAKLF